MKYNLNEEQRYLIKQLDMWMEYHDQTLFDVMIVMYEFIFDMTSGYPANRNLIMTDLKYYLEERQKSENEVNK